MYKTIHCINNLPLYIGPQDNNCLSVVAHYIMLIMFTQICKTCKYVSVCAFVDCLFVCFSFTFFMVVICFLLLIFICYQFVYFFC